MNSMPRRVASPGGTPSRIKSFVFMVRSLSRQRQCSLYCLLAQSNPSHIDPYVRLVAEATITLKALALTSQPARDRIDSVRNPVQNRHGLSRVPAFVPLYSPRMAL